MHVDPFKRITVTGVDNHQVRDLQIVSAMATTRTQKGLVALEFHRCAFMPNYHSSIHAPIQLRANGVEVNDEPILLGGSQTIKTPCGHVIPLSIKNGLPCMKMWPATQEDMDTLPRIQMTKDKHWEPSIFDNDLAESERFCDAAETEEAANIEVNVVELPTASEDSDEESDYDEEPPRLSQRDPKSVGRRAFISNLQNYILIAIPVPAPMMNATPTMTVSG
jgi:hypothetical protein